MASIMEARDIVGDPNRAIAQLNAPAPVVDKQESKSEIKSSVADRFSGKSREEVIESYQNLESLAGRHGQQIGYLQRRIEELAEVKRNNDLQNNGASKTEIEASDILTKPTEALDKFLEERLPSVIQPMQDRINQLENQLSTVQYERAHSDAADITKTAEFRDFVSKTGFRQNLAAAASNGDVRAADTLLNEYKASRALPSDAVQKAASDALRQANGASLEGNRSAGNGASTVGTILNRADLIELRANNPDKYAEMGKQILAAYAEGRVR